MSAHDAQRERSLAELAMIERLVALCAPLPEVTVGRDGFGHTVFKVGSRSIVIVGSGGDESGGASMAINVDRETQRFLVEHAGFHRTPYIGQHGWSSIDVDDAIDWSHIGELVRAAYRRVAPRRLAKRLPPEPAAEP